MNVGILGRNGQLSWELQRTAPENINLYVFGRETIDFSTVTVEIMIRLIEEYNLTHIINAAACTAVDKAEGSVELAYQVNAYAVEMIAKACAKKNVRLIHVSTDFVFDGNAHTPYPVDAAINPQSVYGKSKAMGEKLLFACHPEAVCIRTSWVYSSHGNNFVKTMLRLMAERESLGVVVDQKGSPTWAYDLAQMIWHIINKPNITGLLHWSNHGIASWYDFACAINLLAKKHGLLSNNCEVRPIKTAEYPTPAARPAYSVLDKTKTEEMIQLTPEPWLISLEKMLGELKNE